MTLRRNSVVWEAGTGTAVCCAGVGCLFSFFFYPVYTTKHNQIKSNQSKTSGTTGTPGVSQPGRELPASSDRNARPPGGGHFFPHIGRLSSRCEPLLMRQVRHYCLDRSRAWYWCLGKGRASCY
jgi:hypothetical protein